MIFKRFFDPKLAQASYLIGCPASGEALVVDPNRAVERYLAEAEQEGLRVAHVTETHIHADFVSGSRELSHRSRARLYLSGTGGAEWRYQFADESHVTLLRDGSCLRVGAVRLEAMHLPGHTPEHLVFLVTDTDSASQPMGALTGDFLFVGDVGRPDLLERSTQARGTMEGSARELFRSLQRFRTLPDYLQIWPGHSAGSACGKSLGAVPQSTIGYEKLFNWAFGLDDEGEFVRAVLAGQPDPPAYFAHMKRINREGPELLGDYQRPARLSSQALAQVAADRSVVLDTRPADEYARGAIPGTINIPRSRAFTTWAGSLLPYGRELYLIVDDQSPRLVDELVRDLTGIGLDRIPGYFGTDVVEDRRASNGSLQTIPRFSLAEFLVQLRSNDKMVLDVRTEDEWDAGHVPGSLNVPVAQLEHRIGEIPRDRPVIVHCQTGSRAAIASSILRARGLDKVGQFPGGFAEWQEAGQPVVVSKR
jgi:hydroxyacylglutathione hydrolase